ncbi:sortase domain-containing protein [Lacticaseibacillus zhaodongensis]|uniref:sortase domain-containing protein n=1 Tax=Lacticaseibacillus zhaodongensis TaxID=2668065 RepID=UPI0012D2AB67|nr:sortase [Lacticaseibacillus zhaodongensis]
MKFNHIGVLIASAVMAFGSFIVPATASAAGTQTVAAATKKAPVRNKISFAGVTVPVVKGNMHVTSAPHANVAQTWGGQTTLSTTDHQSTHMIGHNNTSFGKIVKLKKGSAVTVHDVNGKTRVYHVTKVLNVTDQGYINGTKTSVYKQIVNANQGEQVVLQTCLSETVNRLVWAR